MRFITTCSRRRFCRPVLTISLFLLTAAVPSPAQKVTPPANKPPKVAYLAPTRENYLRLASETETTLRRDVLDAWFPITVDNQNGGFSSNFTRDWKPYASQGKYSVFQGRMTWISAQVVMRRPELKDQFAPYVHHGVDFLTNVLWDKQYGGFFMGVDDHGQVSPFYTDGKHLYGMGFCIYALAAAYQATGDPKALSFAQQGFRWLDDHAHDAKNGGYFEWLSRAGNVVEANPGQPGGQMIPLVGFPLGYKSMNTHIHLLEAFTQLYEVWKDDTLHSRLQELLETVRDKICVQPGAMNLYFTPDWRAIPDHDSFGHDVETAYLMLEAEDVLGGGHDSKTEHTARALVDHALATGWDQMYGGFYGEGTTFGKPDSLLKEWWVEMEGLNALLLMHEIYGSQSDIYFKAFQQQWQFIRNYQTDPKFRGVYEVVGPDGAPVKPQKGEIWKAAYHDGRALLNVTDRLKRLAETKPR